MKSLPTIPRFEVFKNRKRILNNPLPFHNENFEKYGDIFRVKIGLRKSVVFTRNPGHIKQVLQTQNKKYHKSPLQTVDLAKYIGHGILTSNGEHWRTHRRMVQPAFHKKKLLGLLGIMQTAIRTELKRIKPNVEEDIFPLMGDLAFQVVAKSLFSRSDIQLAMAKLQDITETNQKMLIKEMRQPYMKWWFNLSGQIRKHMRLSEIGRDVLDKIIEERIQSGEEKDDLLDMLLKARYDDGTPMPRRQLIDEVMILFTAGHETTANVLSFTLFLLAKNKKDQQRVFEEVSQLDLDSDDIMQNISQLTYTKQCIEESMRLFPPAYVIDRISIEEDTLGELEIPKNTLILMSIYELHRYASYWDSPSAFRPERFDVQNKKDFQDYYYPFGAGPRMCVGNNFAMYEMVLAIAEIIKKYDLQTDLNEVEINPLISLKPKEVPLVFLER
ncbi:MAG: cytochrome P450 [Maribacter sp.]|uniref:cytochrome P450 n=1 Tax=Maribacter sp. TaxID=1897614 RepID=UPI003C74FC42